MKGYFCADKAFGGDYDEYGYSGTITCLLAHRMQITILGLGLISAVILVL